MDLDGLVKRRNLPFTKIYDDWYRFSHEASEQFNGIGNDLKISKEKYSSIVFAGMGGSATVGDMAGSVVRMDMRVIRSSVLPEEIDRNSLVIASSISGNTYETIEIVKQCAKRKIDAIVFSSGGMLGKLAKDEGFPHVRIKYLGAPRLSLPCLVYPVMNVLKVFQNDMEKQIRSSLQVMKELSSSIKSSSPQDVNPAKKIASFIGRTLPVCYYNSDLRPAGVRFRNSLNENAKTHAISEDIEEACHNSIVPFSYKQATKNSVVLLRSMNEPSSISSRFAIVKDFLESKNIRVHELTASGDKPLAAIMGLIYLLDYSSIYLAMLNGHDPNMTAAIDYVKSAIQEKHQTDLARKEKR